MIHSLSLALMRMTQKSVFIVFRFLAMGTVQLPPEIWDRIFDFLSFRQQLDKAVVCRAWNGRVARRATLTLSCPSYNSDNHVSAVRTSLRLYRRFAVELLRTEEEYQSIRKVVALCKLKFTVQKLYFGYVTSAMLKQFFEENFDWVCTVRSLYFQLCDDELFPTNVLRNLVDLRELRLINVGDTNVDWTVICDRLEFIQVLTIDAAWHYNDEALSGLIDTVSGCKRLKELTLRANDTASLGKIAESLLFLEKLALVRLTVRLEGVLSFPALKLLNLDIGWFVFDKPHLVLSAPFLQSLRISKKTIPFVKFTEQTKIKQLDLFGHCMSSAHPSFSTVEELTLTTWEPPNADSILDEIKMFQNVQKLTVKLRSKECAISVPSAISFQHIKYLHLNNFILSIDFFTEIAQMKLLEHLTLEECNFYLDCPNAQIELPHLSHFRVKRVSVPMLVVTFPVIVSGQPPVVLVDKLRTHLWRNDHFNVFSSKWE